MRRQSRRAKRNTKRGALRHGPKARNRRQAICSQALSSGLRTTRRPLSAPPASGALRDVLACHASLSGSLGGREGIRGYPRWRAACDDAPFLGVLGSLAFAWCDASRPGDPRSLRPGPPPRTAPGGAGRPQSVPGERRQDTERGEGSPWRRGSCCKMVPVMASAFESPQFVPILHDCETFVSHLGSVNRDAPGGPKFARSESGLGQPARRRGAGRMAPRLPRSRPRGRGRRARRVGAPPPRARPRSPGAPPCHRPRRRAARFRGFTTGATSAR